MVTYQNYEILGSMPKNEKEQEELSKSTTLSDFSLGREYIKIGATLPAHQDWGLVTFYLGKNTQFLIATIKVLVKITNTKQEVRNKVIFSLNFKTDTTLECEIPEFENREILQVNRVRTYDDARGLGIAVAAYVNLAKRGFIVLSDNTQFTDGKMLWKSIINEAELKNYKISIINVEKGVVGTFQDVDEDKIWTVDEDYSGERMLLALHTL